jgi:hypothetical protein
VAVSAGQRCGKQRCDKQRNLREAAVGLRNVLFVFPGAVEGVVSPNHGTMTGTESPTGTGTDRESHSTSGDEIEMPRCTVQALVNFADKEVDSFADISGALAEIFLFLDPDPDVRETEETVRLPRETVKVFETYFGEFVSDNHDDADDSDDILLLDEEFWDRFDDATETARQALDEQ